jgi:hypothetical protein
MCVYIWVLPTQATPAEVVRHSSVTLSMLADPLAIEQVYFGKEGAMKAVAAVRTQCTPGCRPHGSRIQRGVGGGGRGRA